MYLPRALILAAALLNSAGASAQSSGVCTPEFMRELRTVYNFSTRSSLAEVTQEIACSKKNQGLSGKYKGGSLKYSDVQEACNKKSRDFFSQNATELAMSFLPESAIGRLASICNSSPNNLTLNLTCPSGGAVTATARWSAPGTEVRNVTVRSFTVTGPATCPDTHDLGKGARVGAGGSSIACSGTGNGKVTAVLNSTNDVTSIATCDVVAKSIYAIQLNSVDDSMTCTVNGAQVAGLRLGQPAVDMAINQWLRPGVNELRCEVRDEQPNSSFQPCWGYLTKVLKNGVTIAEPRDSCCGATCVGSRAAPSIITVPITIDPDERL